MKALTSKKSPRQKREHQVLLGLVEYYLKNGKPVGSNTLKEAGFGDLSSATIRNYFSRLEEEGFLSQQHSSGGRIPTAAAYRYYANEFINSPLPPPPVHLSELNLLQETDSRELTSFLQQAANTLSEMTRCAIFLSAPRFDQDFIIQIRVIPIDSKRILCILITDFGMVQTELIATEKKLSAFAAKRLENYFQWRLTGNSRPENLDGSEEEMAHRYYNELMVRYIVSYSHSNEEDIYRTGFSRLLSCAEFQNPSYLATTLGLFENTQGIRLLLKESTKCNQLKYWIGEDLISHTIETPVCSILAIPYYINQQAVGAVGMLGPMRIPYRSFFGLLGSFSESLSNALTRATFKYKISFRPQKSARPIHLQLHESSLLKGSRLLLEDKR